MGGGGLLLLFWRGMWGREGLEVGLQPQSKMRLAGNLWISMIKGPGFHGLKGGHRWAPGVVWGPYYESAGACDARIFFFLGPILIGITGHSKSACLIRALEPTPVLNSILTWLLLFMEFSPIHLNYLWSFLFIRFEPWWETCSRLYYIPGFSESLCFPGMWTCWAAKKYCGFLNSVHFLGEAHFLNILRLLANQQPATETRTWRYTWV